MLLSHHRLWDYIELRDAADSPPIAALLGHLERAGVEAQRTVGRICYYIPLPSTFDEYLSGISISLRGNFRRRWRNLQRDNHGQCLALTLPDELQHHFPTLLALHRMRLERRETASVVSHK